MGCILANQKFRKSYSEGTCGSLYCNLLLTVSWTFTSDTWTWVSPAFTDWDFAGYIGNLLQYLVTPSVKIIFLLKKKNICICNLNIVWIFMIIAFCSPLLSSVNNLALSCLLLPVDLGKLFLGATEASSSWGWTITAASVDPHRPCTPSSSCSVL